jgi:hypothetical protein
MGSDDKNIKVKRLYKGQLIKYELICCGDNTPLKNFKLLQLG